MDSYHYIPYANLSSPDYVTTTTLTPVNLTPVISNIPRYTPLSSAPLLRTEVVHHNDWVWYLVVLVVILIIIIIFVLIFWLGYGIPVSWRPTFGTESVATDVFDAKDRSIYVGGTNQVLLLTITLNTSTIGSAFAVRNIGSNQISVKAGNFSINPANNADGTIVRPGQFAQFMVTDSSVVIRLQ